MPLARFRKLLATLQVASLVAEAEYPERMVDIRKHVVLRLRELSTEATKLADYIEGA